MRNGDYYPSRMDQQLEAAQFIINLKRQSNVENSISILTMGAPSPKVMISLSSDQSKLFHALNTISISGEECNLFSALNVAQLVLKHRQNPNQRQRVILFVGSALPREEGTTKSNEKTSEKGKEKEKEKENRFLQLAKIFKKNNICVDVIAFGEEQEDNYNVNLLNEFVETIVGGPLNKQTSPDTSSNIVVIPVDGDLSISEAVRSSGIIGSQGSMVSNDFGIDPDMDPELAMVSLSNLMITFHFIASFLFFSIGIEIVNGRGAGKTGQAK